MKETVISYFNKVYDDTYFTVFAFVSARCGNSADISDIMQDIYADFYHMVRKKGIDYAENPTALLITMARAHLSRYYKRQKKRKDALIQTERDVEDKALFELEKQEFEWEIIDHLMLAEIWQALAEKDEEILQIFKLRYIEDMSLMDISNKLSIPFHTVRNRLYRTIEEIKERFSSGETSQMKGGGV